MRQALSLQTDLLKHRTLACDEHRSEVTALDESMRALADRYQEKASLCLAQEEEVERLQEEVRTKEKQTDLLLELMQSSDTCSNDKVRELADRIQEQLADSSHAREQLEYDHATRRAMQDKHRSQVSQLEAKLSKAERAHQELQRVQASEWLSGGLICKLGPVRYRGPLDPSHAFKCPSASLKRL